MTPETFQTIYLEIARKGHRKPGRTYRAARKVLVQGMSCPDASRALKVDVSALHKLVNKINSYRICECCQKPSLK